jgi:hypothetical protein
MTAHDVHRHADRSPSPITLVPSWSPDSYPSTTVQRAPRVGTVDAERILERSGSTCRTGTKPYLWWLKSHALLANAEGDWDRYAELATRYLELCEKLDARGRLTEARRMVGSGTAEG